MDPIDRQLLNEIHGNVSGLKPILEAHGAQLLRLEDRTRGLEGDAAKQAVKTERLQQDLNGLGGKVRVIQGQRLTGAAAPEATGGKWLAFLEVLAAAPKWAHALLTIGSLATTVGVILWKHWPK